MQLLELGFLLQALQFEEALDTFSNGGKVGERAAQPTLIDVKHPGPFRLLGNQLLGLLFGRHKQDLFALL